MLSKLNCCDTFYYPWPEFQLKRSQHVQLVAPSFVLSRYVNDMNDIVRMGLTVRQGKIRSSNKINYTNGEGHLSRLNSESILVY